MLDPRLKAAAADRRLRGAPLSVLLHEWDELDDECFTPKKALRIAHELHMKEVTAGWALRHLVETGYLERGAGDDRPRVYRRAAVIPMARAA